MFGIAPVDSDRRSRSKGHATYCHLSAPAGGPDIQSRFKERAVASGALVLVCLAPLFACAKIPTGHAGFRTVQDPIQAAPLTRNSEQSQQAGEKQDANSQRGAATKEGVLSKPPQITYVNGQLTIVAENSQISEIMSALRAAMGTDIDLPANVARQRIWVRLGPGPARKVLRELLDNTELDYVIQASDTDQDGIRSVLLTFRSKTAEPGVPGTLSARGTGRKSLPAVSSPVEDPEQESSAPAESAAVADTAPAGPPSTPTGAQYAADKLQSTPGVAESSLSRPGGGASEQMIQQLQSMYQQRRQLQIQQNQKPTGQN
jgi:hypothetical protein